jgi:hypothetical protein
MVHGGIISATIPISMDGIITSFVNQMILEFTGTIGNISTFV